MVRCFIVPPYVLDAMTKSHDAALREHAHRTQLLTEKLAVERTAIVPQMRALALSRAAGYDEERRVYDAEHEKTLPGTIERTEGAHPAHDRVVNEAYDAAGVTWDFYRRVFGRDSVDGRGMELDSSVHYDRSFDNAFWNGAQMVYGDGDGALFGPFTHCLDVIAHELTHGVTQFCCDLEYRAQSGALNESLSDVFGSMVKQYHLGQHAETADWLIGSGLFVAGSGVAALRSLKAPGTAYDDARLGGRDPQPAHMRDYYSGPSDAFGVHINSGIPNHAFYLTAVGFGGASWEKAGRIWYDALTSKLDARCSFRTFASATIEAAHHRFGSEGSRVVSNAWHDVGVVYSHARNLAAIRGRREPPSENG